VTGSRWLVRSVATAAVVVLGLGVVGCGGDDEAGGGGISVGLVTDTGGVNDRGFNEFSIAGLDQAADELGVETRIYVSASEDDYLPNLTEAAEDGHELVISVGFLLTPSTTQIATEYPDTSFAGVDHFFGGEGCEEAKTCEQPNALGMVYPSEEAGYLAGIIAALTTESKTVSSVGGIKIPPVDNWIAGFQQGVADTDPSVKTLNAYSQDFVDQAKCKEIALDQISQGSKVVFQVAGQCGLGALDAAKEKGVQGIGVDADQAYLGEHVLTSALKKVDVAVFDAIKRVQDGSFKGGTDVIATVENGGVGLGKISPAGEKYADQLKEITDQIAAGEIADIPDTVK
jgi:basic membrane protein A